MLVFEAVNSGSTTDSSNSRPELSIYLSDEALLNAPGSNLMKCDADVLRNSSLDGHVQRMYKAHLGLSQYILGKPMTLKEAVTATSRIPIYNKSVFLNQPIS